MSKFFFAVIFAMNCVGFKALAREGYWAYSLQAPWSVSAIWNSVFYVLIGSTSKKLGTASLVNIQRKFDSTELYFLTNNHVVRNHCPKLGVCDGLELGQDVNLVFEPTVTVVKSRFGQSFKLVEVFNRSNNPDLALLRVVINSPDIKIPRVVHIPDVCVPPQFAQKLVTVGFPSLSLRTGESTNVVKRWSDGLFVSAFRDGGGPFGFETFYYGTTVDLLNGGSGSPVVDESGSMVGVMVRSSSVIGNQFRYQGSEAPGALDWQSLVIPCRAVNNFIYGK